MARWVFLLAVPLGWAVLLTFHPNPDPNDIYGSLHHDSTRWLVVHGGTLIFIDLLGVAVFLLVRGLTGPFATAARIGAGMFATFYGAGEAVLGIATGVLVRNGDAQGAQILWDTFVTDDLILGVGAVGWVVAALSTAVALRRAGAPAAVPALLALSTITVLHGPPIGPLGLMFFAAAVALLARRPLAVRAPVAAAR